MAPRIARDIVQRIWRAFEPLVATGAEGSWVQNNSRRTDFGTYTII